MTESFGNGSNKRPVLKIPYSAPEKIAGIIAMGAIIVIIAMLAGSWSKLPNNIATHFDFSGKPDGWGGKGALLILPIISVFIYVLLTSLAKFPHVFNYAAEITEENAEFQYKNARMTLNFIKAEVCFYFCVIEYSSIMGAYNNHQPFGIVSLPLFIIIILITIIYFVRKSLKYR